MQNRLAALAAPMAFALGCCDSPWPRIQGESGAQASEPTRAAEASEPTRAAETRHSLEFKMKDIDGDEIDLAKFKGKVVLFVNVARHCGYTVQYEDLQSLYEKHEKDGLVIVGVPANDFGNGEPDNNGEIKKFCSLKYNVKFPVLAKVKVVGPETAPTLHI